MAVSSPDGSSSMPRVTGTFRASATPQLVISISEAARVSPTGATACASHAQIGHGEIMWFVLAENDEARAHIVRGLQERLRLRQLSPAVGLAVGHQEQLLEPARMLLEHIQGAAHRRVQLGTAVRSLRVADGAPRQGKVVRGLGDRALHHVGDKPHRDRGTSGQRVEDVFGRLLRLLEFRSSAVGLRHAARVVDGEDGDFVAAAETGEAAAISGKSGAREPAPAGRAAGSAAGEQEQIFQRELLLDAFSTTSCRNRMAAQTTRLIFFLASR